MSKKRESSVNIDDESTTNRDVEVDRDTTVDRDTNVDVSVEASSADADTHQAGAEPTPAPNSDQIPADQIDWTVDYGGDPVHPTEIPREDYIIPLPEPEAPPVEPEP